MAVRPSVADAKYEIQFEEGRIAVAVAGLQADHSRHQVMIVRDRTPAHQRRNDGNAGELGELDEEAAGVGVDDAAARHDQRPLGSVHHFESTLRLRVRRRRLVNRQGLIGLDVVFDLGGLHVDRQVDQHGARTTRPHHMERLLKHHGHERRLAHSHRPFRH